jgi:hypothetical protein
MRLAIQQDRLLYFMLTRKMAETRDGSDVLCPQQQVE